ncbi:MAG: YdeI/OmpD-associated family protein [Bacteroidetes bacterium]|nr:YdeI/OmpD-associated family protein [Bacteroidota bacterium]
MSEKGYDAISAYLDSKCDESNRTLCDQLRRIFLQEGLEEALKWRMPCYSYKGMVCSLGVFKNFTTLWFPKGALLCDPDGLLIQAQESTKGMRSMRFESEDDLDLALVIRYVKEAMLLNEKGLSIPTMKKEQLQLSKAFKEALDQNPKAKTHFQAFSMSKQREYVDWINSAKREGTREKRILKSIEMLEKGLGKEDKYR